MARCQGEWGSPERPAPGGQAGQGQPFVADLELPLYVANFVLIDYGTGAIFGCPAHDQRDLDFARMYGLSVSAYF